MDSNYSVRPSLCRVMGHQEYRPTNSPILESLRVELHDIPADLVRLASHLALTQPRIYAQSPYNKCD